MHGQHGFDLVVGVRLKTIGDLVDVHCGLQAEIHHLDVCPDACGGIAPAVTEPPCRGHQHLVTGGYDIAKRCLPGGVAVANIHRHMMLRARDTAQIFHQRRHHIDDLTGIDIGGRTVHRVQHSLGHDRRTGDREVAAPL